MLTGQYHQYYQELQQALQQLKLSTERNVPDVQALQAEFLQVQQFFQLQIIPLELDSLPASEASKLQSIQTEISKQFRLLGMDIMFLQAARQSVTAQKRQVQIGDRLNTLIQYCDAVLQEN